MLRKELIKNEIDSELLMEAKSIVGFISHYFFSENPDKSKKYLLQLSELLKMDLGVEDFEASLEEMDVADWAESLLTEKPRKLENITDHEFHEIVSNIFNNQHSESDVNWWMDLISINFSLPSGRLDEFLNYEVSVDALKEKIKSYKPIIL